MRTFLAAFVVATLVGGILTPFVRHLALRLGAVTQPGGRHVHGRTIPRLGGVAITLAFFAPLAGLFFVESVVADVFRRDTSRVVGLFVGGMAMCTVGIVDDTRGLRALYKLYAQIAVAIMAFLCGFRIDAVALPLVGSLPMGVFAMPVTVIWIVGIVNAVNLIDGLDGLAAGVVFFAGLTNFTVAYLAESTLVALLMASTMGAVVGFLFYNFNPARIFMGDSGSYFLGFVLAATSLAGAPKASTAVSLLVPVVALGVPIFDTLFAMMRRILERRSIFSPDRGHIHHRLLDMGITHRRAVLIIYGVSVVFTLSAIAISLGRSWQIGVAMLGASVVLVGLVRFVGYFEYLHIRRRQQARIRSRDAEFLRYLLPRLPARFAAANAEAGVLSVLEMVVADAEFSLVQVIEITKPPPTVAWEVRAPGVSSRTQQELITARYPIGREGAARCDLKFGWRSDFGDVSPQTEILLQVVADMLETHLCRVCSPLAPSTAHEATVAAELGSDAVREAPR